MAFYDILMEIGYDSADAKMLANYKRFIAAHKKKTAEELNAVMERISKTYGWGKTDVLKSVLKSPSFASLDHKRVLNGIEAAYRCTKQQASAAMLKYPQFANLDHKRVLRGIQTAYACTEQQASKAVLKFPRFAGYDHQRVLMGIQVAYACTEQQASEAVIDFPQFANLDHKRVLRGIQTAYACTEQQASKAVLKFPRFAGYDHQRVLIGIQVAYACTEQQASEAVMKSPRFAGLDHKRVLKNLSKLGRLVDVNKEQIIKNVLERPVLAEYSAKRYIAAIDVGRALSKEGIPNDNRMLYDWLKHPSISPYVPETDRLRISQDERQNQTGAKPPLMALLRNKALRRKEKDLNAC